MKTRLLLTSLITAAVVCGWAQSSTTMDLEKNVAPVVVKTVPEAGSKDFASGEVEIKIKFSKEMADKSWSCCKVWDNSLPEVVGQPRYESDHKTCVLKVKLEPGRTYGIWINTPQQNSFQDIYHHHAVPYLLAFKTAGN